MGPHKTLRFFYGFGGTLLSLDEYIDGSVLVTSSSIHNIYVTMFSPKNNEDETSIIIYFHGGAWVFGSSSDTHYPFLHWLARSSKIRVIAVDYGLSPEVIYDQQLNDCLVVTRTIFSKSIEFGVDVSRAIIAGDSAGGNIAASVALILAEEFKFSGCILLSPSLQCVNFSLPSMEKYRHLFPGSMEYFAGLRAGVHIDSDVQSYLYMGRHVPLKLLHFYNEKYLNVLDIPDYPMPVTYSSSHQRNEFKEFADDYNNDVIEKISKMALDTKHWALLAEDSCLQRLPPTFIQTSSFDFLRDDALLFAHRLDKLNVKNTLSYLENSTHVEPIISFFKPNADHLAVHKGLNDILLFISTVLKT